MSPLDVLTVHQLLGRLIYFHVLFFESRVLMSPNVMHQVSPHRCCPCRHVPTAAGDDENFSLADTAWAGVAELVVPQSADSGPNCSCCAAEQVSWRVSALTRLWVEVEHHTYWDTIAPAGLADAWAGRSGGQVGAVFARQFNLPCTAAAALPAVAGPDPEVLPLSAELLALWHNPFASNAPVISWLNHCTDLHDIRLLLTERKSRP